MTKQKSHGPQGRPWTNVRTLARQHTTQAVKKLAALMDDANPCVALAAASALLDRGYGRVPAGLKHTGKRRISKSAEPPKLEVEITHFREVGDDAGRA